MLLPRCLYVVCHAQTHLFHLRGSMNCDAHGIYIHIHIYVVCHAQTHLFHVRGSINCDAHDIYTYIYLKLSALLRGPPFNIVHLLKAIPSVIKVLYRSV